MTDTANGGLPEAAAKLVGSIDSADVPPHEYVAGLINSDDDNDVHGAAAAHEGEQGDKSAVDAPNGTPRSLGFDVAEINRSYALAIWGGKAVVVNEQPHGPVNDRVRVMSLEAMNSWFANRVTEIAGSDGKIKPVTWAKAWHSHPDRRQYAGVEFWPNPDGAPGTPNYLNFWRGFEVEPSAEGSCAIFWDHVLNQVCDGDRALFNYVKGWMAHMVQKPRERLGTAIVLRGKRGTGKSKFGEVLGSLIPAHYFQVDDARYVTGNFNEHMASCLLMQADEAVWAGDKSAEGRLKGMITSEIQMIESKGVNAIRMPNFLRVVMTSNEGWVVPAGMDERRFVVLDVNPRCIQNHAYFAEMDEELNNGGRARLLHDLLAFDLSTVNLRRIPQTKALLDQKLRSLDTIDDFWFNRLHDGGEWVSQIACNYLHEEYLKSASRHGIGRKHGSAEFGKRLAQLVPGLRKPRLTIEVEPGIVGRVWCYELPSLHECRAAFDELLGQSYDWPALPPGEGERAQADLDDDGAPV